jgi:hypothetical protein
MLDTAITISTGEPDARKTGTSGSEGGRQKRTSTTGTSLAAYPTSRRDLWEPGGEVPPGHPTDHLLGIRPGLTRHHLALSSAQQLLHRGHSPDQDHPITGFTRISAVPRIRTVSLQQVDVQVWCDALQSAWVGGQHGPAPVAGH